MARKFYFTVVFPGESFLVLIHLVAPVHPRVLPARHSHSNVFVIQTENDHFLNENEKRKGRSLRSLVWIKFFATRKKL